MSLEPSITPSLEEDLLIVFLMFHAGIGAYVDVRIKDRGFEDSHHMMNM